MKTFIHKLKQLPRLILSITLLSVLAACGGGSTPAPTPPSGDATLTSLKLSAGDISPEFASGTLVYTLKANQNKTTTVTAVTADAGASIKVNEETVVSNVASESISLPLSDTTVINVVVTAADGVTTKTYTVTVLSRDTSLSDLTVSADGMSPAFASGTLEYTLKANQNSITVTPIATHLKATIRVNGETVERGDPSKEITLPGNLIAIKIVVTAEDEETTDTYIINASRNIPKPVLSMSPTPTKDFVFTFSVAGDSASKAGLHYELSENKDGSSGFVKVKDDMSGKVATFPIETKTYRHNISLIQRLNARYMLSVCTTAGVCVDSNEVTVDVADLAKAIGYFKASNTGGDDWFGYSVALSADGNTLAVGAYGEDSQDTGINPDTQSDNSDESSGAVYVFSRTAGVWSQQAYVKASNTSELDYFGESVALSADGNTLAVGARYEDTNQVNSGAVYVFSRTDSAWSQQAFVKASNAGMSDNFGSSVALSADGKTLAVGAVSEDSNGTGINPSNGDSASNSGAVYVFSRTGSDWLQQAYVKASNTGAYDRFGWSVALSADGNTLAVGARYEDSNGKGINPNTQSDNSAESSGAVYVFSRTGGAWSQQAYVKASNTDAGDEFGWSVALSADGSTLAVGAYDEDSKGAGINSNLETQNDNSAKDSGAVYVFSRSTAGVWSQQAYVKASNTVAGDWFGYSVALSADGNTLAVGAVLEDSQGTSINPNTQSDNSVSGSGAVYVFSRTAGVWSQQAYVKASNTGAGDSFGYSVALSTDGNTLAVGASYERSKGTGINSDTQSDNSASNSGAVYLY